MNIINFSKAAFATFCLTVFIGNSVSAQLDAPDVMDIQVCDGDRTVIVPTDPNSFGDEDLFGTFPLATENFDGGGIGYTSSIMFNDGSNDHFNITDGSDISNVSGAYGFDDGTNLFWAAEDVDDAGGDGNSPQTLTLNSVTITNYNDIEFCFDLAAGNANGPGANGYDLTDYVTIDYSIDGNPFVLNGMCFNYMANGDDFNEPLGYDIDCDGDGSDGGMVSLAGTTYCFTIPDTETDGAAGVEFRINVAMNSASEEIAFDNIEVSGTPIAAGSNDFNYYDMDPISGMETPVGMGTTYDPMTTVESSPDSIWVTVTNGQDESDASLVVITVIANPVAEAGDNQSFCGIGAVDLMAVEALEGQSGLWTGGNGTFADDTRAVTTYTPAMEDLGTAVVLTWTVSTEDCGDDSDDIAIYFAMEAESAEFSYAIDTICPGDGVLMPMHETGVDGYYQLIEGEPDSIDLDSLTGAIDIANSGMGEFVIENTVSTCGNLMITGAIDGPLFGGIPKAIELYAVNDISDLSAYGFGSANNGGGTDGEEFTFPAGFVAQGTYLYIASDFTGFMDFFGFEPDFISGSALINGDDALELFCNDVVIDVFGDIDVDGTGEDWEYLDGWLYRNNDEALNAGAFTSTNWFYSGPNALDGSTTNADANPPFPLASFTTSFTGICPNETHTETIIIGDFEAPMVICPSDMTISLDGGDCGAFAALPDPMAIDNCTDSLSFEYVSGPMNGDYMDKENSPYTVVYEAVEDNGNVITCSYMITIEEFAPASTTLACNGSVNVSLDENCESLIGADVLLEGGGYGCYEDYGIVAELDGVAVGTTVQNEFGSGYSVILDNSILDTPIEISVIDIETGNSCWGTVTVEDKLAPVIDSCNNLTLLCGDDFSAIEPSVTENCSDVYFELEEDIEEGTCQDTFSSQITRIWIAIDGSGNVSEPCVQIITILKDSFSDIQLPSHYDGLEGNFEPLACDGAGVTFAVNEEGLPSSTPVGILSGTGVPTLGAGCSELIVYYDDLVIPTCGNSYKVLREWTIVEWCTGEVLEYTQIIKVHDTVGPVFTAPSDLTVAATPHCHGEWQLPLIPAIDNCGTATVSFSSDEGVIDNGYFLVDVPELGYAYTITATATDECGVETNEDFTITFIDLSPPIVIAETSLTVSLASDGVAKIFASSFDDGSYDGCTGIGMSVIRMFNSCDPIDKFPPAGDDNFQFNEIVHFCCSDVDEPQMVVFRVCDDADGEGTYGSAGDNCNTAMVEVIVQDKIAPVITCPEFMTVSCIDAKGLDLTNNELMNELFGEAVVENSCSGNFSQTAILSESCGSGIIIRTFIATNSAGSTLCSQAIAITQTTENTLTCDRINFADLNNNTYNWCTVNDNINNNNDDLPAIEIDCNDGFSIPALDINIDGLCSQAGEKVTVDTFNFAGGACKKYLLHYEVIDQCVFDENYVDPITGEIDIYNTDNGYFEFFIEIDAFDNDGPEFDLEDIEVIAENCTDASATITANASDLCTDASLIGYQHRIDLYSDDSIDYPTSGWANGGTISTGSNGLGLLPVGIHTIYWLSSDGCGNNSATSQIVEVLANDKEPTPYCVTGYKVSISAMGMISVTADQFDAGSFDNCSDQSDLVFSFSPDISDTERMYTCDDLGFQFIQVYVTDEDGNQDFCNTSFLVQDNGNFCGGMIMAGQITSDNGYMNKEAQVKLMDENGAMGETMTDDEGQYILTVGAIHEDEELIAEDNNDLLRGVTTLDIITIQKHILGIAPFTSNAQYIAADVNNSETVTGADIIQIRKVILGYQDYFANNTSWALYPADFNIEAGIDPYAYPKAIDVMEATNYNWKSIKVADVNASHTAFGEVEADTRSDYKLEYMKSTLNGKNVYDFYPQNSDLVGLELKLNSITNTDFMEIENGSIEIDLQGVNRANGAHIVWYNIESNVEESAALFSIVIDGDIDETAFLNEIANGEAFVGKGAWTDAQSISLRERDVNAVTLDEVELYPNPFSETVQLDLSRVTGETSDITIFDFKGQVLSRQTVVNALISIPANKFGAAGIYYIQVESGDFIINRKVLLID